jgi:hypothetical protein
MCGSINSVTGVGPTIHLRSGVLEQAGTQAPTAITTKIARAFARTIGRSSLIVSVSWKRYPTASIQYKAGPVTIIPQFREEAVEFARLAYIVEKLNE